MSDEKESALFVIPLIWFGRKIAMAAVLKVIESISRKLFTHKGFTMEETQQAEVSGAIGSGGSYSLDVQGNGMCVAQASYSEGALKAGMNIEFDVVVVMEKLAQKSDNKIDDSLVAMIKAALGR